MHWCGRGLSGIALLATAIPLVTATAGGALAQLTTSRSVVVAIHTFQFKPTQVSVTAGTPITWTNNDDIQHTVTSGTPERRDDRFNATLAGKDATFSVRLQPGTYPYFCDRHQSMRGEIRVD